MEYLIGFVLAAVTCIFGTLSHFDRERVFYPTMLFPIATYFVLFAAMAASPRVLTIESTIALGFMVLALVGFKWNLWIAAAGLAGHGVFDLLHHALIENPGVPVWWPGFCAAFDVLAAVFLAALLVKRAGFASPRATAAAMSARAGR